MGFTPLAGLVMGTRCGDIDPAVVTFLMEKERLSVEEAVALLNKQSGVLGLSGLSHDFRDIENAATGGDERAEIALAVFVYSVKKFIGAHAAALNGLDALVFTGGLGENSDVVRSRVCESMEFLGIAISTEKNLSRAWPADISLEGAETRVLVIPTNEELMIARETVGLLAQLDKPNP
jgi:acetate kinase